MARWRFPSRAERFRSLFFLRLPSFDMEDVQFIPISVIHLFINERSFRCISTSVWFHCLLLSFDSELSQIGAPVLE
jgi:hypothetical protein